MSRKYLIDTNILSSLYKGNSNILNRFELNDQDIFLSSIVASECYFGVYKSNARLDLEKFYDVFFKTYEVINQDLKQARLFGRLKANMMKSGNIIEDFDLLIATQAMANNLVLVTNNIKHFNRIEGLEIEDWTVDDTTRKHNHKQIETDVILRQKAKKPFPDLNKDQTLDNYIFDE